MVEIKGRKFTVILREEPEGGYSAQCVELPGAISQGNNRKQALANIKEAIEGYLEAFPEELDQLKRKRELVEITLKNCLQFRGVKSLRLLAKRDSVQYHKKAVTFS
jgi:predicted RNase H-like HicB family nuclease